MRKIKYIWYMVFGKYKVTDNKTLFWFGIILSLDWIRTRVVQAEGLFHKTLKIQKPFGFGSRAFFSLPSSSTSYVWNILFFMYFFRWSTPDSRTTPPSVSTFPFHITFTSLSICLVAKKTKPKFLNIVFDNFSMSKQGIFFLKYEVFGDEIFWIYYVLHMWSRLMVFILVASIFVFFRTEERSHFHYLYLIVAWFWCTACKARGSDLRVHFKVVFICIWFDFCTF